MKTLLNTTLRLLHLIVPLEVLHIESGPHMSQRGLAPSLLSLLDAEPL
jgi:hypothetical protein